MDITLLKFLLTQGENEWIEFKKDKPQSNESIGEYISALEIRQLYTTYQRLIWSMVLMILHTKLLEPHLSQNAQK